jgi:rhamnose transport system substrate-binding protein
MKIRGNILATTLIALAALSGCEKRDAGSPTAGPTTATAGSAIRIVYIPKNTGNPYFNGINTGFEKGCGEQPSVTFNYTGPANPDATSQISFVKDQVQQGANVICISPNSVDALNSVFDEARAKGVKIICVNSDITGNETHRDAAILPTDFTKVGAQQIEMLGSQINYEGKFAILSATTDAPDQNFWIAGMKEALKDPKYAKMQLVDTVYGDDKPEKSRKEAEGLLTKYPDLRAILAPTSVGVEQAAKTVEAAGVYPGGPNATGPGIVVTGLGTPDQMRSYINKGVIKQVALWNPPDEGYLASYLAVGVASGIIKLQDGQTFTIPGLGDHAIGKDALIITGPPIIFTKDNIGNYHF